MVAIGRGELGERERVLLSIAERAGAVELEPGGGGGLLVTLTGQGSPRAAYAAIKAAKDRGWESYRSIERYMASGEMCRRRQILDHFGDARAGRAERPLLRRVRPGPGARAARCWRQSVPRPPRHSGSGALRGRRPRAGAWIPTTSRRMRAWRYGARGGRIGVR